MNCSKCGKEKGAGDWIALIVPRAGEFVFCGFDCLITWFEAHRAIAAPAFAPRGSKERGS